LGIAQSPAAQTERQQEFIDGALWGFVHGALIDMRLGHERHALIQLHHHMRGALVAFTGIPLARSAARPPEEK